jgi:hypothetical protein
LINAAPGDFVDTYKARLMASEMNVSPLTNMKLRTSPLLAAVAGTLVEPRK